MGGLRKIAVAVLVLSFVTFVALFGRLPALRNTPVGFLHRLLWHHIPEFVQRLDRRITGGRLTSSLSRFAHYAAYEKHPIVLIFFLSLLTGASGIFLLGAWAQLPLKHHVLICLLLPLPYLFTYLCAYSTTSHISPANHTFELSHYPYDYTNYYPGHRCRTCLHLKPARSKHCSICGVCVARHDHHCVWVNNCLGRENYRWFLGLLFSLGFVLDYGAFLAYILLRGKGKPKLLPGAAAAFWNFFEKLGAALASDAKLGAIGLLAALTAPLAWGLLAYHIYLIWAGTTTNETQKWEDLKYDMGDGLVFKAKRSSIEHRDATRSPADNGQTVNEWPAESDQIIQRTDNGEPPAISHEYEAAGAVWERCWHLNDVINLYDLGFVDNLRDALDVL